MRWLILVGFIAVHLLTYAAVIRHLRMFAIESMIVVYHAVGFAVVFAVVSVAFGRGSIGFAALCGLLALQLIYSMSFLELWTLSEGSYSLQILARVSRRGSISREELLATSEAIGARKKLNRLDDLLALKLIARTADGRFELSPVGDMLARSFEAIMRLTAIRKAG
jgi:hypothetical protein